MNKELILFGVGVGLVALVAAVVIGRKAGQVAGAAVNAINPLNHDNVFASSVNDAGAAVTGDKNFTLGGFVYDITHWSQPDLRKPVLLDVPVADPDPDELFNFGN